MNKSISISLGSRVFFIEEDAFEKLDKYLKNIRLSLKNEQDIEEIIYDVELRIAELFEDYLKNNRQSINNFDIDKVINKLGSPENFILEDQENVNQESINTNNNESENIQENFSKTFFRDYDNKIIAGVIGGIAKYFNKDATLIRLIIAISFSLLLFVAKFGEIIPLSFLFYIIFVIVVPYAKTTSDKLKMVGKPINIESIKEQFYNNEEFKKKNNRVSEIIKSSFSVIGKIIIVTLGLSFIFIGFSLISILFAFISEFFFDNNKDEITNLITYLKGSDFSLYIALFSLSILCILSSYLFIIGGLKCLINKFKNPILRKLNIVFSSVWIISLIVLIIGVLFINLEFSNNTNVKVEEIKSEIINVKSDTLSISWNNNIKYNNDDYKYKIINNRIFIDDFFKLNKTGLEISLKDEIELRQSNTDKFKFEILYESFGKNEQNATENIKFIKYNYSINSNNIILDKNFLLQKESKYRKQFVHPILYIPKGKYVKIENISHVYTNNRGKWIDFNNVNNNIFSYNNTLIKEDGLDYKINNNDYQDNQNQYDSLNKKLEIQVKIDKLQEQLDSLKNR